MTDARKQALVRALADACGPASAAAAAAAALPDSLPVSVIIPIPVDTPKPAGGKKVRREREWGWEWEMERERERERGRERKRNEWSMYLISSPFLSPVLCPQIHVELKKLCTCQDAGKNLGMAHVHVCGYGTPAWIVLPGVVVPTMPAKDLFRISMMFDVGVNTKGKLCMPKFVASLNPADFPEGMYSQTQQLFISLATHWFLNESLVHSKAFHLSAIKAFGKQQSDSTFRLNLDLVMHKAMVASAADRDAFVVSDPAISESLATPFPTYPNESRLQVKCLMGRLWNITNPMIAGPGAPADSDVVMS